MTATPRPTAADATAAADSIRKAAGARKCWSCGCLHSSPEAIRKEMADHPLPNGLAAALAAAESCLVGVQYDCRGCAECYPADAVNALALEGDACPADPVERREGWPPLPGNYAALRYQAPVAVCTLTDEGLYARIREQAGPELSIVGALQTENLGIERLIENVLANPNIRFLVLCGADSQGRVGHLPGQSMVALAHSGLDERGRITGAKGKRPVVRNLASGAIEHFCRTVEVVDHVGETDADALLAVCRSLAAGNPQAAEPFESRRLVQAESGYLPERMVSDPRGYFVIYADHTRGLLSLEHYDNNGSLDLVIEGRSAPEVYVPAIEKNLVSRLDHAAYLGRELARAEESLKTSMPYVQGGAPEQEPADSPSACACKNDCGGR